MWEKRKKGESDKRWQMFEKFLVPALVIFWVSGPLMLNVEPQAPTRILRVQR